MTTSKSKWIWFPGDREIWMGNQFNNRRTERGAMFPPFWKQDSHWQTVEFSKEIDLLTADTLHITVEGIYNFMLDGKLQFGQPRTFVVPAGKHKLNIKVHNVAAPPSLHIQGEQTDSPANTDETWLATCEDKIWIDENGVAHGSGIYLTPGTWPGCNDPDILPSKFELLQTVPMEPIRSSLIDNRSSLYDFGRETFGYIVLHNARGPVEIYYGESEAEALDKEYCETLDKVVVSEFQEVSSGVSEFQKVSEFKVAGSKAFRFVQVVGDVERISMLYEYLPQDPDCSASFECSDPELNKIWEVGAYTMDLTTREFMMDGIKRDRWTWSGDAIQSYLMNYYLRFDSEAVKRTIRQLRGKDPVTAHVNTILDYTFYWFNALGDYYLYTGDVSFIKEMYTRAKSLMDYTLGRLTDEGLAIGQPDDWVFVDWVDFPMHKRGILCFEQILLYKSLQTMAQCAELAGDTTVSYASMAEALRAKTDQLFWNEEKHAYLHALEDQTLNEQITKFPNMMAILYGFADADRQQQIMQHVMQNEQVPAITTPYMRFYELAARCQHGQQEAVLGEIKSYWGGMLRNGATSFWEKYNPEENGQMSNDKGQRSKVKGQRSNDKCQMSTPSPQPPHLEMYGRPYGKSLCHAWGASPIYLLGKYYLGVEPTEPGYARYTVKPNLGGLASMSGKVPTPFGPIEISATPDQLTVTAPQGIGIGTVIFNGQTKELLPGKTLTL